MTLHIYEENRAFSYIHEKRLDRKRNLNILRLRKYGRVNAQALLPIM
jgi:hypothetical protein